MKVNVKGIHHMNRVFNMKLIRKVCRKKVLLRLEFKFKKRQIIKI